jgi:uncharacterized protein YbjT (DUF2867 family)
MAKRKSLLLLGATGLVGGECLGLLRDDEYYGDVTILTRTLLPDGDIPAGARQYAVDFNQIDRYRELVRADDVVCAFGSTIKKAGSRENFYRIDFGYPYDLAKTAVENGARRFFLVSAMGADSSSFFFYNRVKGELEEAIGRLGYESVGIFRPSLLLGKRREFRPGEVLLKAVFAPMAFVLPGKFRPVPARAVAAAIWRAVHSDFSGIRTFESDAIRRPATQL